MESKIILQTQFTQSIKVDKPIPAPAGARQAGGSTWRTSVMAGEWKRYTIDQLKAGTGIRRIRDEVREQG